MSSSGRTTTAGALSPEAIGRQLLDAFPGLQLHSASLHDQRGDTLWQSDDSRASATEREFLTQAQDAFLLEGMRLCFERHLANGRVAMAFPARTGERGGRPGVAMVVGEAKSLDGSAQEKALSPNVQAVLKRLSLMIRPPAETPESIEATLASRTLSGTIRSAITGTLAATGLFRSYVPPVEFADLSLYVQQLLRLRTSGGTRRYEVLLRARAGGEVSAVAPTELLAQAEDLSTKGALDRYVLANLIAWLKRNRESLEADPATFSINISAGALADDTFPDFVKGSIRDAKLPAKMLGFELRESMCREHRQHVERFINACERMGCYIVIDDFTLQSDVLPLLRHKAVRLVKIDANLTASAVKDKLSQAVVVAIAQAAKVLGTHCVAKRIDSSMARQWLAAIGVDFAQGFLLEGPLPLATLASMRDTQVAAES